MLLSTQTLHERLARVLAGGAPMTVVDETSREPNHVSTAERLSRPGRDGGSGGGRDGSAVFVAMIAFLVLLVGSVVAIGLIALLTDVGDSDGSGTAATTVDVALTEFSIDGQLTVPEGEVTLAVSNNGSVEHNLVVRELDTGTPMIPAGGSATLRPGRSARRHVPIVLRGGGPRGFGHERRAGGHGRRRHRRRRGGDGRRRRRRRVRTSPTWPAWTTARCRRRRRRR